MKNLNKDNFNEFVRAGDCLVQFSAEWCGPCKVLTRIIESTQDLAVPVGKIDIDSATTLVSKFGIKSVPTLILFRNGKESERAVGGKAFDVIKPHLNE